MEYKKDYFNWQKNVGCLGGVLNLFKFKEHIKKDDVVVDFGSGGGYLLKNMNCSEKLGIEINKIARKEALGMGIKSVESINEIKDNYADVIVSNHALEHVDCPLEIIKQLKPKLKKEGKIIFIVPHQGPKEKFMDNDINQHLYTWNPLTLGNLFKKAGYRDIKTSVIRHTWPPKYKLIYDLFGKKVFNFGCIFYAFIKNSYQIKIVAKK
jgi:SAM-dependent methyltransferase